MSENELREALREIAAEIKPAPDPYPRLMRRQRRRINVHLAGWSATVAVGLVLVLFGQLGQPDGLSLPTPNGSDSWVDPSPDGPSPYPISPWTRALIQAPPRGGLAADRAFVDGMAEALRGLQEGPLVGLPVNVLFAGDVGDRRFVVAARYDDSNQAETGLYLVGPKGAGVGELVGGKAKIGAWSLDPFTRLSYLSGSGPVGEAGVALAPPGCAISTAAAGARKWEPVAGKDVYTWTEPVRGIAARVDCAGRARYEGPLAGPHFVSEPAQSAVDAAMSGMRGTIPRDVARGLLVEAVAYSPVGQIKFLYGGTPSGETRPLYLTYSRRAPVNGWCSPRSSRASVGASGWPSTIPAHPAPSSPSHSTAAHGTPSSVLVRRSRCGSTARTSR